MLDMNHKIDPDEGEIITWTYQFVAEESLTEEPITSSCKFHQTVGYCVFVDNTTGQLRVAI